MTNLVAQTLNPTNSIRVPGTADTFKGGYTFSYATAGTPWNGALISFGGLDNRYDCQISADYGPHGGNRISFRTKSSDLNPEGIWNSWNELATRGENNFEGIQTFYGGLSVRNLSNSNNSSAIMISHSIANGNLVTFGTSIRSITESEGSNIYGMQFFTQDSHGTGQTEKVRIQGNGNVGIGTTAPDSKLTVAGNIHAQEVKVTLNAGVVVPDYVFANDYKLKPLQEVEEYIKANNHLPEIPSAKEIEKNGLMLAEMNLNLLKKIEELTLHAIQQQKNITDLTKIVEEQNRRLNSVESK
ncbi:hypothetical protein [Flavobacterium sp. FlaQc-47]|uniref:hypothetical protein n=1 Tax=Flavobacterium sp. FlaQc-47 TaxID=3374180 RepID=UPI0037565778